MPMVDLMETTTFCTMCSCDSGSRAARPTTSRRLIDKERNRIPAAISGSIIKDASGTEVVTVGFAKDLRDIPVQSARAALPES